MPELNDELYLRRHEDWSGGGKGEADDEERWENQTGLKLIHELNLVHIHTMCDREGAGACAPSSSVVARRAS